MEMLVRQIFDMVLNLSNRFDSVIQSAKKSESKDSVIAMKDARIDELTRENVALKNQLEERNKEFDRLYAFCDKMASAMEKQSERMYNVEIAVGARKE